MVKGTMRVRSVTFPIGFKVRTCRWGLISTEKLVRWNNHGCLVKYVGSYDTSKGLIFLSLCASKTDSQI